MVLETLGEGPPDTGAQTDAAVNMSLSTTPQPTLNITFRRLTAETSVIANIDAQILPNAEVLVEIRDGFEFDDDESKSNAEAKMARALDVCWDLGVWIEWIRGQYS